jgi:hypothetical protein
MTDDEYIAMLRNMTIEQPSAEAVDRFDHSIDEATHAIIAEFDWIGLPEGDQLGDLMVRLNDAIASIMREWL